MGISQTLFPLSHPPPFDASIVDDNCTETTAGLQWVRLWAELREVNHV